MRARFNGAHIFTNVSNMYLPSCSTLPSLNFQVCVKSEVTGLMKKAAGRLGRSKRDMNDALKRGELTREQYDDMWRRRTLEYESHIAHVRRHGGLPPDFDRPKALADEMRPLRQQIYASQGGRVRQ